MAASTPSSTPVLHPPRPVAVVAALLGAAFAGVARLRGRRRPLHPDGVVLRATLERHGTARPWGSPWTDEPGTGPALVRLSRSAGLPAPLPDVLGLALRVPGPGRPVDVLLSTTGTRPGARHVLLLRRDAGAHAYTTLLPYRSPRGPVLLAAVPAPPHRVGSTPGEIAAAAARGPLVLELRAAGLLGGWEAFATLVLHGPAGPAPDGTTAYDPVLHPPPGLVVPPLLAALRRGAYAGARRGRRATQEDLRREPEQV